MTNEEKAVDALVRLKQLSDRLYCSMGETIDCVAAAVLEMIKEKHPLGDDKVSPYTQTGGCKKPSGGKRARLAKRREVQHVYRRAVGGCSRGSQRTGHGAR